MAIKRYAGDRYVGTEAEKDSLGIEVKESKPKETTEENEDNKEDKK